jgi:hypothetical protein
MEDIEHVPPVKACRMARSLSAVVVDPKELDESTNLI